MTRYQRKRLERRRQKYRGLRNVRVVTMREALEVALLLMGMSLSVRPDLFPPGTFD